MTKKLTAIFIATGIVAAGCGSSKVITSTVTTTTTHTTPPPKIVSVPTPTCPLTDVTMQCVLAKLPPPPVSNLRSVPRGAKYGIDFAYGAPSIASLNSIGANFGASYISHTPSKDWSSPAVQQYHTAKKGTVMVYETSANRAESGPIGGHLDASYARGKAASLGNTSSTIDFAIDCDCTASSIDGYFRALHQDLGNRENAYGGYHQLHYLIYTAHLVGNKNWQTYAWSGSGSCQCGPTMWLPTSVAPLEQYLNGNAFDNDHAFGADYGQWPSPAQPNPCGIFPTQRFTLAHGIRASECNTVRTWRVRGCRNPVRRAVCKSSRYHDSLLRDREWYVAHHTVNLKHTVRKARWGFQNLGPRFHVTSGILTQR